MRGRTENPDLPVACSITANTYSRAPVKVTVSKKSHARSASACERRKSVQVAETRLEVGGMPASFTQTVDAATFTSDGAYQAAQRPRDRMKEAPQLVGGEVVKEASEHGAVGVGECGLADLALPTQQLVAQRVTSQPPKSFGSGVPGQKRAQRAKVNVQVFR